MLALAVADDYQFNPNVSYHNWLGFLQVHPSSSASLDVISTAFLWSWATYGLYFIG